jgi:hypothetical protein
MGWRVRPSRYFIASTRIVVWRSMRRAHARGESDWWRPGARGGAGLGGIGGLLDGANREHPDRAPPAFRGTALERVARGTHILPCRLGFQWRTGILQCHYVGDSMIRTRLYLLPLIIFGVHCAPGWLDAQELAPPDASVIRGLSVSQHDSVKSLRWPPADDHIRSRALLGALIGGVSGAAIGFRVPCRSTNERPMCELRGAAIGLGTGLYVGNTLGAWAGGGRSRCGPARGLARAAGGALIGSVPYTAYMVAMHNKRVRGGVPTFVLAVTLPFLQAEGATRAVSGC